MRVLAVDPGEKRIGLALSDPTGTIAAPLPILKNRTRADSALRIAQIAHENHCKLIIIGDARASDGSETFASRRSRRLAGAIHAATQITVELWDEWGTTQSAIQAQFQMGIKKKNRARSLDSVAATVLLQSYLEERLNSEQGSDLPGFSEPDQ